jgi:hypothetical protein
MPASSDPAIPTGSCLEVGNLYDHSSDGHRRKLAKWSLSKDPLDEEQRMKELGRHFAVVHRYQSYEVGAGELAWRSHSVVVQSPRLRGLLDGVFADYPDWSTDAEPYTFASPFKPLVHRWDRILQKRDELDDAREDDRALKAEIALLDKEVGSLISGHVSALKHTKATGVMAWSKLWLVYAPGDLMVVVTSGGTCLCRLRSSVMIEKTAQQGPSYWGLELEQYDWNGSRIGAVYWRTEVYEYVNDKLLTKLRVYPIIYADGGHELRERTLARGRKFEALRGYHFKACHGQKIVGKVATPVSSSAAFLHSLFFPCPWLTCPPDRGPCDCRRLCLLQMPESLAALPPRRGEGQEDRAQRGSHAHDRP